MKYIGLLALICLLLCGCQSDNELYSADRMTPAPVSAIPGSVGGGATGLILSGGGTLTLGGTETYTGGSGITAGAISIGPDQPLNLSTQPDTAESVKRLIIYSGVVRLVVIDRESTSQAIRKMADGLGGYLQEMDQNAITVRIPAAHFDEAVDAVGKMGTIVEKQIKAADVTEELRDLDIRLANAKQTRTQLLQLMDKSAKMEDTVKIAAELERVTGEMELLEGKIRYLQSNVALSVLRVMLNVSTNQPKLVAAIPFPWVRELGGGAVAGETPQMAQHPQFLGGGVGMDLASGYLRYYQRDDETQAMSADGVMIKVERHENYKGGDVKFWSTLAKRALLEQQAIAITSESETKAHGQPAWLIQGIKDIPGNARGYILLVAVSDRHVYTFEAWGGKDLIQRDLEILKKAAESVEAD